MSTPESPRRPGSPQVKSITALRRGIEVLEAVRAGDGLTLHAVHQSTGLPKASLLRILKTLEEGKLVQRRIADGAYLPCAAEPLLGARSQWHIRLVEIAAPSLRTLHAQLPWPSDIAVRDGTRMLVLESNRPLSGLSVNRKVVGFHPHMLLSALGRAYIAFCPTEEREAILAELAQSAVAADRAAARRREWIEQLIAQTREQGYGLRDRAHSGPDADMTQRFCAIAVPIMVDVQVEACLSCVWLEGVATAHDIVARHLDALKLAAGQIGRQLAAKSPPAQRTERG